MEKELPLRIVQRRFEVGETYDCEMCTTAYSSVRLRFVVVGRTQRSIFLYLVEATVDGERLFHGAGDGVIRRKLNQYEGRSEGCDERLIWRGEDCLINGISRRWYRTHLVV